jgi:hypothetical protein
LGIAAVFPALAEVFTVLAGFRRELLPATLVFPRRHARRAMKGSRETGLRREMRIERYRRQLQFARGQLRHGVFQANATYVSMW